MANQESTSADTFVVPVKCIKDEAKDMAFFQASEGYARILSYILALNTAALNRKASDRLSESEVRRP
jgi:serine/threonine-protein phosphatase 2A activator